MIKAVKLMCESLVNPLGLSEKQPCFSWLIVSDEKNVLQAAYHIQVAQDADMNNTIWDSGEICSDESAYAEYRGGELSAATRYFWRVKITDNNGNVSDWSETAWFETALDKSMWQAVFVSPEPEGSGDDSRGKYLKREFVLNKKVISARVYATAKGMFELFVNGKKVGEDVLAPGWTAYDKRHPYQTYDIGGLLIDGENEILAHLGCGWYKGCIGFEGGRNQYGDRLALICQIHIEFDDGTVSIVSTDQKWCCADSPVIYSEIYHGETYDARLENPTEWKPVFVLDDSAWLLVPQDGLPVRRHSPFSPKEFIVTPKGERVIDFGQNMSGWVRFSVKGKAGERVVLRHAEVLDHDGNFYTENLRSALQRIEYICDGKGEAVFEPHFTFQGFRYVLIEEYPGEIDPQRFEAVPIYSDMPMTGSFSCSNDLVNQLHHNIEWGLRSNFVDVPTDCPQRDERLGWTGDAQVFARTACSIADTRVFFRKWLRDMAAEQLPDGGIMYVVPDVLMKTVGDGESERKDSACGWADAATIIPWTLYMCYGNKRMLREHYPMMKKWVGYIRSKARDNLWDSGFHFGDWVALDAKEGSYIGATPNSLLATAYYAYSTKILIDTANVLGYADDTAEYTKLYTDIVRAYREEFFTSRGRLASPTQTAHIISLIFDLTPDEFKERIINDLLSLLDENEGHLTTGFLGTPYFTHVLSQCGRIDKAYDLLLKEDYPSWLYQVKMGATTIWEHWDGIKPDGSMWSANMNSFNHYAYGSIGEWLYRVVAGIDALSPGFKRIRIAPRPGGGLTRASAEIMTPYGAIASVWEIKDGIFTLKAVIPHNTAAEVIMPDGGTIQIGSGRHELSCKQTE